MDPVAHRETVEACIRIVERWVWDGGWIDTSGEGRATKVDSGKERCLRELRGFADDQDEHKHLLGPA